MYRSSSFFLVFFFGFRGCGKGGVGRATGVSKRKGNNDVKNAPQRRHGAVRQVTKNRCVRAFGGKPRDPRKERIGHDVDLDFFFFGVA